MIYMMAKIAVELTWVAQYGAQQRKKTVITVSTNFVTFLCDFFLSRALVACWLSALSFTSVENVELTFAAVIVEFGCPDEVLFEDGTGSSEGLFGPTCWRRKMTRM